jgi:hypothetical protein
MGAQQRLRGGLGRSLELSGTASDLEQSRVGQPLVSGMDYIDVLGATSIACEDSTLPTESQAKLVELRTRMLTRVTRLCRSTLAQGVRLSVIINVFSGTCNLGQLPSCVVNITHIPGSKLAFWSTALTPELTSAFQIIWCFDNDLAVDLFPLHVAARSMLVSNTSMSQPCIPGGRNVPAALRLNGTTTRGTDIPNLRCHGLCSKPIPQRGDVRFGGIQCLLRKINFIEVMTPIFTVGAWALQHRQLLSQIPHPLMIESDRGLSEVWCSFFKTQLPHQPACALLCIPLVHFNGRTIDVSNHSHVRGEVRFDKNASQGRTWTRARSEARLVGWSHQHFRRYYDKAAARWSPGNCMLRVNATSGALARAITRVNESAPRERPCGASCQRRNRLSKWG